MDLDKFINPLGGIISSTIGAISQGATNNQNAALTREGWDRSEAEALRARTFNSQEALNQRNWEEKMYDKYQSIGAQVDQYNEAGLNPALMYGKGGMDAGSVGGGSAATGSAASISSPIPMQNPIDALTLAQARNLDAKTDNIQNNTTSVKTNNEYLRSYLETGLKIKEKEFEKVGEEIKSLSSEIMYRSVGIKKADAEIGLLHVQKLNAQLTGDQLRMTNSFILKRGNLELELMRKQVDNEGERKNLIISEIKKNDAAAQDYLASVGLKVSQKVFQQICSGTAAMEFSVMRDNFKDYSDGLVYGWKGNKRSYKWAPVNNIVGGLGKVAGAAAGIMSGAGILVKGLGSIPAAQTPTNGHYF